MSEAVSMFVVTTFFPVHLAAQTPNEVAKASSFV